MTKKYIVIDNDNFGTLAWTHNFPATLDDIAQSMHRHHETYKNSISISRYSFLPSWGAPTLSNLLNVYNLTIKEMEA